jgi:hypothetical protein
MRIRRSFIAFAVLASLAALPSIPSASAEGTCPFDGPAEYSNTVPTVKDVLGFRLGHREASVDEAYEYLDAVDAASDKVITGTFATSVQGRPLRYAMVGLPERLQPDALEQIREALHTIRDPDTPRDEVESLAATTPPFLYIAGNVHGTEESGTEGSLRVLYDLADRTDCASQRILDSAVVVIIPTQNPDGREADTRRNAYGFDMNRDWFARTQPETDGKVELLRQNPPSLYADAHEFSYYRSFFAPNDDPVYHDAPDQVLSWIDDLFAPALAREFRERDWGFFHYHGYDFFMPGYGDTVPADGFMAPAFTLEHYDGAPLELRTDKVQLEFWLLLSIAARNATDILVGQHDAYVNAVDEGRRGILEPNVQSNPNSHVLDNAVPNIRVRDYFLMDDPDRAYEVQLLVRRLQRMDVEVYRLDAPLDVPDYRPYTEEPRARTLPAGTYWIPMAQAQKHWIQLMLNEDTYVPVRRTYDITGWSNPLLMDLAGGYSGATLEPSATPVDPLNAPTWTETPQNTPRLAILELSKAVYSFEGSGQLRWLLDTTWHLPYDVIRADRVRPGLLDRYDVVVVPSGGAKIGVTRLGSDGAEALRDWVADGGRYVGYKYGGALLAGKIGITDAVFRNSPYSIEGTLIRVNVDPDSPLAAGVGRDVWVMFASDDTIKIDDAYAPMRYPPERSFDTSGLALHTHQLAGQPAAVDQAFGRGRVVVFPYDLNFRGITTGTQRILWNAITGPDPARFTERPPRSS